jgi:hypothetical protein
VKVKELDLRSVRISCSSHPIIVLSNVIPSIASEGVDEIRIVFREEDIPEGALKLFLSKYSYFVEEVEKVGEGVLLAVARKRG